MLLNVFRNGSRSRCCFGKRPQNNMCLRSSDTSVRRERRTCCCSFLNSYQIDFNINLTKPWAKSGGSSESGFILLIDNLRVLSNDGVVSDQIIAYKKWTKSLWHHPFIHRRPFWSLEFGILSVAILVSCNQIEGGGAKYNRTLNNTFFHHQKSYDYLSRTENTLWKG